MLVIFYNFLMYLLMNKWTVFYLVDILFSKIVPRSLLASIDVISITQLNCSFYLDDHICNNAFSTTIDCYATRRVCSDNMNDHQVRRGKHCHHCYGSTFCWDTKAVGTPVSSGKQERGHNIVDFHSSSVLLM